ncbi:MAG: hypothetical protein OXM62_04975 [bacterium]|nr:hypothetical protein [bacterium]MDE0234339.1 hypothetical protein [bacterium]
MAYKAPGKSHRTGISLLEPAEKFPTEQSARVVVGMVGRRLLYRTITG